MGFGTFNTDGIGRQAGGRFAGLFRWDHRNPFVLAHHGICLASPYRCTGILRSQSPTASVASWYRSFANANEFSSGSTWLHCISNSVLTGLCGHSNHTSGVRCFGRANGLATSSAPYGCASFAWPGWDRQPPRHEHIDFVPPDVTGAIARLVRCPRMLTTYMFSYHLLTIPSRSPEATVRCSCGEPAPDHHGAAASIGCPQQACSSGSSDPAMAQHRCWLWVAAMTPAGQAPACTSAAGATEIRRQATELPRRYNGRSCWACFCLRPRRNFSRSTLSASSSPLP
jgi:hypothetical protein